MIRERFIVMTVMGVMLCGVVCGPARGQAQVEVLVFDTTSATQTGWEAARVLGYAPTRAFNEGGFENLLRTKTWDLVVIEIPGDSLVQKTRVLALLESHIDEGGRLLVNYNNLDEWPELRAVLGIDATVSFDPARPVFPTSPAHQTFLGVGPGLGVVLDPWDDSGDELVPSPSGVVIGVFQNGAAAIVLGNDARTITNGFDWDTMTPNNISVAQLQMQYIVSCKADLDHSTGHGVLDIFDFLEFQNLFVQQNAHANFAFDAKFDIFDFLAFQEAFVNGCD